MNFTEQDPRIYFADLEKQQIISIIEISHYFQGFAKQQENMLLYNFGNPF